MVSPPHGEQQTAERRDVLITHAGAVDFGSAERGEQVVAEVVPPVLDDRDHVGGEFLAGAQTVLGHLRVLREVAEEGDDRGVPAMELVVIAPVQAEHVDDDVDGEKGGELSDEVHFTNVAEPVDEFASVPLDHRQELLLERPAPEGGRYQRASDGVLTTAHLHKGPAVYRFELPLVVVAGEDGVLEGPLHVLVPRNDVATGGLVPDQRRLLPHGPVRGVGIGREAGRKYVEV